MNGLLARTIVQINASDSFGGAARIAMTLLDGCGAAGAEAWLVVHQHCKHSSNARVIELPFRPRSHHQRTRVCDALARWLEPLVQHHPAFARPQAWTRSWIARPVKTIYSKIGIDDFDIDTTAQFQTILPAPPAIIHGHNLFPNWFDLRALYELGLLAPVVLTLHDEWMLTGHCAGTMGCQRWRTGCGHCPDLSTFPPIAYDVTAINWKRKRAIYRKSRLHVATPSRWLMEKVRHSMLLNGIVQTRVIPNGVDLTIFHAEGRETSREALRIPSGVLVLMFSASGIKHNPFKDYVTIRQAIDLLALSGCAEKMVLLVVGEEGDT